MAKKEEKKSKNLRLICQFAFFETVYFERFRFTLVSLIFSTAPRGKRRFLGRFENYEDAVAARKQAEQEIIAGLENEETRH